MASNGSSPRLIWALARFLTLILIIKVHQYECYPHQKRALSSMSQVINILSDELREEEKQTSLLTNLTMTYASESSFSRMISLLKDQAQHLENITVTQNEQARQIRLLENIAASLQKLSYGFPYTARDCSDIASQGPYRSGAYTITPWDEQGSFKVYCDMDTENGDWVVIQRRFDGSVNFYRDWEDYKNGFGDVNGELWIGLDKLNRLTNIRGKTMMLRVELTGFDETTAYAQFDDFVVGDESSNFALESIGNYEGTAGDSLRTHLNKAFSTKDRDNDVDSRNCATRYHGAWWYASCYHSSLNGPYQTSALNTHDAIVWHNWKAKTALKSVAMKIKTLK